MTRTASARRSYNRTNRPTLCEVDAVTLLTRDHDAIRRLFRDYEWLIEQQGDDDTKAGIVDQICSELSLHAQIEEEVFFPAIRAITGSTDLTGHMSSDHASANELIAQLDELEPSDARYDTLVAALCAHVVPHMNEEQAGIFLCVRLAGLDTAGLGHQMAQRQKAMREDVTLVGLPHANAGAVTWPMPCHVVTG
jgi:hypothetical protein